MNAVLSRWLISCWDTAHYLKLLSGLLFLRLLLFQTPEHWFPINPSVLLGLPVAHLLTSSSSSFMSRRSRWRLYADGSEVMEKHWDDDYCLLPCEVMTDVVALKLVAMYYQSPLPSVFQEPNDTHLNWVLETIKLFSISPSTSIPYTSIHAQTSIYTCWESYRPQEKMTH